MEQHINYITLGVADLAESRRFYRDVFGWQETAGSNENIAFFQAGNALLLALFGKAALAQNFLAARNAEARFGGAFCQAQQHTARAYLAYVLPQAHACAERICQGAESLLAVPFEAFASS